MKTSTRIIRLGKALALSAVVAGAAVSAAQAGIGGRPPDIRDAATGPNVAIPDVFERYVTAHPYGQTLVDGRPPDIRDAATGSSAAIPDVFERYVAAHPYGQTRAPAEMIASHFKHEDALYRAQVSASGLQRSATAIQAGASDGFDWSDYGVGIGTGIGLALLFAGGLAGARQRRHRVQAA